MTRAAADQVCVGPAGRGSRGGKRLLAGHPIPPPSIPKDMRRRISSPPLPSPPCPSPPIPRRLGCPPLPSHPPSPGLPLCCSSHCFFAGAILCLPHAATAFPPLPSPLTLGSCWRGTSSPPCLRTPQRTCVPWPPWRDSPQTSRWGRFPHRPQWCIHRWHPYPAGEGGRGGCVQEEAGVWGRRWRGGALHPQSQAMGCVIRREGKHPRACPFEAPPPLSPAQP